MRGIVSTPDRKEPVALQEVGEPHLPADEALVAVKAFSFNRGEFGSLSRQPAGWQPGQDIAGVVTKQAADGSGPAAGTRIVGLTEECGWAERVGVKTTRLAVLPDSVSFEDASALPIAGLTAVRALRRGGFLLNKAVMVTGATGIVGNMAVQLAAAAGARVTAVARKDAAGELRALGAAEVVEKPTDSEGRFDLVLESNGGETLAQAMARVAAGGRIVVYGNTSGEPAPFSFMNFRSAQNASIETLFHYSCEPAEEQFGKDLEILVAELAAGRLKIATAGMHDWSEMGRVLGAIKGARYRGKYIFRVS